MNSEQTEYQKKLIFWRSIFLLSFTAYFLNNVYLYFGIDNTLSLSAIFSLLLVKTLPLLAFTPWVIKPNFKAALGFTTLLCFYFALFTAFAMFQEGLRGQLAIFEGFIFCALFWSAYKLGKLH